MLERNQWEKRIASAWALRVLNATPLGRRSRSRKAVASNAGRPWEAISSGYRSAESIAGAFARKSGFNFTLHQVGQPTRFSARGPKPV